MKTVILLGIVILLLASIVISQLSITEKITTLDKDTLNLTKTEKQKIDSNYEGFKLGKVIDYQKGTHHTYINFDSGYRVITPNNDFEEIKDGK